MPDFALFLPHLTDIKLIFAHLWYLLNKMGRVPILRFLAITQPFLGCLGSTQQLFCGNTGDYYLLIGDKKSWVRLLFFAYFDVLDQFWRGNGRGHW